MALDLMRRIGPSTVVVVVIPNEKYSQYIVEIAKEVGGGYRAVCYVSLNKIHQALTRSLTAAQVPQEKFFFIDGITKSVMPNPVSPDNCVFVSSSSALTELSLCINQVIGTEQFDCLLFDSLSTLLIYNESSVVTQFVQDQMGKLRSLNCVAVFTCLEGDTKSDLLKNLSMFVDQVIHLDEEQKA